MKIIAEIVDLACFVPELKGEVGWWFGENPVILYGLDVAVFT